MSEHFAPARLPIPPGFLLRWLRSGAILLLGLLALGLYLLIFRPMTQEAVTLEAELEDIQREIAATGFNTPKHPGAYLEAAQGKLERMGKLADKLTSGSIFHPGMEELLSSSFRVLEFEQRRFDIRQRLTDLAKAQGSSVPKDLFAGLPAYRTTTERQQQLWLHLEFFNHVMEALLSSGRDLQIDRVESLPLPKLEEEALESNGTLLKLELRLKVRGPASSLASFLNQALPGSGRKKAYSLERVDLQRASDAGQVILDAVLSGYIFNEQDF